MPLDDYSENIMRQHYFDNDSEFEELLLDEFSNMFDKLWDSGLIEKINAKAGSIIDDYETEFIEVTQLRSIKTVIRKFNISKQNKDLQDFIVRLKSLVDCAINSKRPLCFVF